jgi:hypothetical protein
MREKGITYFFELLLGGLIEKRVCDNVRRILPWYQTPSIQRLDDSEVDMVRMRAYCRCLTIASLILAFTRSHT